MEQRKTVSLYLDEIVKQSRFYFTIDEICQELSLKRSSVSVSLSRLAKKDKVQMIRKGFGIITGNTLGTLHPVNFIDAMMKYLDAKYYVGLLNAASYKGASHQAVMNYTVVADKKVRPIRLKGLKIEFVTKSYFEEIVEIERASSTYGYFNISSPELTAVDLISFPRRSGYWNNIATVLEDLLDEIDIEKLAMICSKKRIPTAVVQRLGYLLDIVLSEEEKAEHILRVIEDRRPSKILLAPSNKNGDLSQIPYSKKWMILENTTVELD
ncbi:MAG: hypothetical protein KAG61_01445 [Bacteriovoracaceae bacterium]|nr:hypothetical protein [Bacteriovoracaceae bacterium]